jgi:hypothetical protein
MVFEAWWIAQISQPEVGISIAVSSARLIASFISQLFLIFILNKLSLTAHNQEINNHPYISDFITETTPRSSSH